MGRLAVPGWSAMSAMDESLELSDAVDTVNAAD
jgi:hypothetical protein